MTTDPRQNELLDLAFAVCDGTATDEQIQSIEEIVSVDPAARLFYLQCLELHFEMDRRASGGDEEFRDLPQDVGAAVELTRHIEGGDSPSSFILHPSSLSPLPSPFSPAFIGGPVFSYMVATVVLGMMLLSAWAYTITHDQHGSYVHNNSQGLTAPGKFGKTPELIFVGQVTGLKDCRWADPRTAPFLGSAVSLNRKYVLSSGLMEITYNSGAKAILEGPCAYEVDSAAGGFLSLGKLTARVDIAKPQAVKTQDPRPKTQDQNPKISKFSVRTPTAIVTDLGTEFGVEVGDDGATISHVFIGSVRVEAEGEKSVVLRKNESVRIEKVGRVRETHHAQAAGESVHFTHPTTPLKFVRRIHEPPKSLNIVDIVAGGNGTGKRQGVGIDPVSGQRVNLVDDERRIGDDQYRPIFWNRLIDGVFIPDGRSGAVQVDSAGGTFDGFPETLGRTWGPLWARGVEQPIGLDDAPKAWIHVMDRFERFTPERRGLLCLHANAGITFNLEAIRGLHRGARPTRFQATVGMIDSSRAKLDYDGQTDLWVIVDGRLKMKRAGLCRKDGAVSVDVELGPNDRFLTLAATDGGDGIVSDWVVLGDPTLKMTSSEQERSNE